MSIVVKKCKCGCTRWPSMGYQGFNMDCRADLKEIKLKEFKARQKKRNAIVKDQREVRKFDDKLLDGVARDKFEDLQQWFASRRREMTGKCACGCNKASSKDDNRYFKHCIAHLFPKAKFKSVATNPLNWVERAFFGGCHTNFDEQGMDKWVNMADWGDIKDKFYELAPELTDEERATKFYSQLEKLVYSNSN